MPRRSRPTPTSDREIDWPASLAAYDRWLARDRVEYHVDAVLTHVIAVATLLRRSLGRVTLPELDQLDAAATDADELLRYAMRLTEQSRRKTRRRPPRPPLFVHRGA